MNKSRKDKRKRLREIEELRKREQRKELMTHEEVRRLCRPSYSCFDCEWKDKPPCKDRCGTKREDWEKFFAEWLSKMLAEGKILQ